MVKVRRLQGRPVTVTYDIVGATGSETDAWFRRAGTTTPTVLRGTRRFITCALLAGYAATGTLTPLSPSDVAALTTIVVQPSTLSAVPALESAPSLDPSLVPEILQQVRRSSGLSWGEIARAVGVSRRTIHNWLSGARVAGAHLARLLDVSRAVTNVATGSVESTRTALLRPNANGRSVVDDLALAARPARRRPLSSVSVGDLVTPVDDAAGVSPQRPHRPSSLRGQALPRRRLEP